MNRLAQAVLGLLWAISVIGGWVGSASAQPGPSSSYGDPCARLSCRVVGAAFRVTIPLPVRSGRPKLSIAPLSEPRKPRVSR